MFYGHYCLVRVTFFEPIISLCLLFCSQRLFFGCCCCCCFAREPWWSQFCCFRKHPFLPLFFLICFFLLSFIVVVVLSCFYLFGGFLLWFVAVACFLSLSLSIFFMGDNFTGRYVWGGGKGGGGEGRWKCLSTVKTSEKITTWHFGCYEEWTRSTCFVCHGI